MAPLPSPEPFELLDTVEVVDARKLRFERNRIKLPMGVEATFGMIRHPGASLAVPITNDGQVVLLRQYRFAVQARLLEFPAGTLEEGEDPLESMQRELGEEAGYSAAQWDVLGPMLPCPGYSDEVIHCFLARAGEHRPQHIPLRSAVAGFFPQLALHRFQWIFAIFKRAGREFEQAGLNRKAVLTQQHHLAVIRDRHRQRSAGVADHPEGGLDTHRQLDPVALETELASVHHLNGVQQLERFR